jgi:hypothetical protein
VVLAGRKPGPEGESALSSVFPAAEIVKLPYSY